MRRLVELMAVVVTLATIAGCDPGVYEPGVGDDDDDEPTIDAGNQPTIDAAGPEPTCTDKVDTTENGYHNAGTPCQGCHGTGVGGAPLFTMGGTLYNAKGAGGTAVLGGTIIVTDADGQVVELVSAANGNFWATQAIAYPVQVKGSLCPDTLTMITPATADCNATGCHDVNSSSGRIHVP